MPETSVRAGRFRKMWPTETGSFHDHLMRLDSESRQLRFCGMVSDAFIARYCETTRRVPTLIHGYFVGGQMRAAGELRPIPGGTPNAAEAAFTVEPAWQDTGIGTALMDRILRSARNRNITTLYMICVAENRRMQHIARKFDARLKFESSEVTGLLGPARPNYFSLWRESVDDSAGFVTAVIEKSLDPDAYNRAFRRPTAGP